MTLSKRGKRKLLLKCLYVTQLLHLRLVPNHPKSIMKDLEGVFLERKMDSDNLYTTSKQHKSAFFFRESVVFFSVQRESNQTYFTNKILVARIHGLDFRISFSVLHLLPVHSSNNHFGSSILSLRYYDLAVFNLHADSQYVRGCLNKKLGIKLSYS